MAANPLSYPKQSRFVKRFYCGSSLLSLALVHLVFVAERLTAQISPLPEDSPLLMDVFEVNVSTEGEDYDPTGMDSTTAELNDAPFSNDLLAGFGVEEDDAAMEIAGEMELATGASPADIVAGLTRTSLRGFPTPRLRNGFAQNGIPEVLNGRRRETIQGPLTPVLGRAAPGGILNYVTGRPHSNRNSTRIEAETNDQNDYHWSYEHSRLLIPKKLWSRIDAEGQRIRGPQMYADTRRQTLGGTLVYRHSRAASVMLQLDHEEVDSNAAPAVPEYRQSAGGDILGPYLPLVNFHAYGPNAGIVKKTSSASLQLDAQASPKLAVRASLQGFWRQLDQDRWTQGQYLLSTGKFSGRREPQRLEQPLDAVAGGLDLTSRVSGFGLEHKITLKLDSVRVNYTREQRALADPVALLPQSVRQFDPEDPDYYRPEYDPAIYSRMITDRDEITRYNTVALSERAATPDGIWVGTAGLRFDRVDFEIADRSVNTVNPAVEQEVNKLTYHGGLNYQVLPGKLLLFANVSTGFEPSSRVDARTGQVQGNEFTSGVESGFRGLFLDKKLSATLLLFAYRNENIARRNPSYNDPIDDPNLDQPELLSAGEEEFMGGTLDLRAQFTPQLSLRVRGGYTRAITVTAPDLPAEEGKALTRLPPYQGSSELRYTFTDGRLKGVWLQVSEAYLAGYVVDYQRVGRAYYEVPGYALMGAEVGYGWPMGRFRHRVEVSVRNLLDRDLETALARPGAQRTFEMEYDLMF